MNNAMLNQLCAINRELAALRPLILQARQAAQMVESCRCAALTARQIEALAGNLRGICAWRGMCAR